MPPKAAHSPPNAQADAQADAQAGDQAARKAARAEYRAEALHELLQIGMDTARFVHAAVKRAQAQAEQAQAEQAAQAEPDQPNPAHNQAAQTLGATFDQLARAIRRTALLAEHADNPPPPPLPIRDPAADYDATKRRVVREVEDRIKHHFSGPGDEDECEALHAEAHERFECIDVDEDIGHRPPEHIITDICRDLGLIYVPGGEAINRRTPAEVHALCARAARRTHRPPGSFPPRAIPEPILHLLATPPDPPGKPSG